MQIRRCLFWLGLSTVPYTATAVLLTVSTVQFRSICHLHVTVTCLTKFSFRQPGWQAVTTAKFRQTRPNNSQNYHIWVGVTSDPFIRQPSDLWQTPNFVSSEGPVTRDWQIDRNCTVYGPRLYRILAVFMGLSPLNSTVWYSLRPVYGSR